METTTKLPAHNLPQMPNSLSGMPLMKTEQQMLQAQTTRKFLELSNEMQTKLMLGVCVKCGIKKDLTREGIMLIRQVIKEKFPSLRASELEIACSMNMYNEFEKKFEHFQSLSPDFVCNVLLEYYKHRNRLLNKFNKIDPYREKTDEEKKLLNDNFIEMICQKFEQYKQSGDVEIQLNKPVFDFLWNKRLMRFGKAKADEY
jgi:hypothetical protein